MTPNPPSAPPSGSPGEVELPTTERDETIFNMSIAGHSERAIAEEFGMSKTGIHKIIVRMRRLYIPERYSDPTLNLANELAILDAITRGNIGPAVAGSTAHARVVIDAHVRRCKLLGLEQAIKHEIRLKSDLDRDIEQLMQMMTHQPSQPNQPSDAAS